MPKLCDMDGVREYAEGFPVELHRDSETGRLVVRARNQGGYDSVSIDLRDLLDWAKRNHGIEDLHA